MDIETGTGIGAAGTRAGTACTSIHEVVRRGTLEECAAAVAIAAAAVNAYDEERCTPLHWAVTLMRNDVCRLLLESDDPLL